MNEVYPDAAATLNAAREMAAEIAANSPLVVRGVKRVLQYGEGKSVQDGLDYVAAWNASFLLSDDLAEAMTAFSKSESRTSRGSDRGVHQKERRRGNSGRGEIGAIIW